MSVVLSSGILAISVDAELDVERRGLDQQRSLEQVTGQLVDLLAKYRMAATWAVADPAVSAAIDRLTHCGAPQEIAILGDKSWVGREAGRSRFARELARRVTRGRSAGLEIATLLLRDAELDDHVDLVVKQELSAVANVGVPTERHWLSNRTNGILLPLRFGLWSFPTHASVPGRRPLLALRSPASHIRRLIDFAVANREVCHLNISALAVAAGGSSAMRTVERVLRHADKRRQAGQLGVQTLAATAHQLTGGRHSAPARSILRPAA